MAGWGVLLSKRIGEAAPLPYSTPALGASLWLGYTTPGNPGQKCASSPAPGDSESSWGSGTYKGCSGLAVQPLLSPQGLPVFPWMSPAFSSPSHVHSPNPLPCLHTWAWNVSWLIALSPPPISSYPVPPVLESSSETSVFQVTSHCPRTKSGHPNLVSWVLWKLTPTHLCTLFLPPPLHRPPATVCSLPLLSSNCLALCLTCLEGPASPPIQC